MAPAAVRSETRRDPLISFGNTSRLRAVIARIAARSPRLAVCPTVGQVTSLLALLRGPGPGRRPVWRHGRRFRSVSNDDGGAQVASGEDHEDVGDVRADHVADGDAREPGNAGIDEGTGLGGEVPKVTNLAATEIPDAPKAMAPRETTAEGWVSSGGMTRGSEDAGGLPVPGALVSGRDVGPSPVRDPEGRTARDLPAGLPRRGRCDALPSAHGGDDGKHDRRHHRDEKYGRDRSLDEDQRAAE